ncbi:hypothetical protein LTR37_003734 [Vermiconidia calcicola]|uniref:Uncharacterized protein n=1 Tax=Vermiconidia calcicola TaxID=1690605 RepID=A0ACC3NRI5_9PEZI|nr:hypothetical protein LTR37_003734 [Vermiconidia calcicola]
MGNCCGTQSGSDNFQGEGRTLAPAPANAPPQTDGARTAAAPKISGPKGGRTLGRNSQAPEGSAGPKEAAARAAEERLKASQGKGKLGRQLDAQKSQTQSDMLAQSARDNVAARDADASAQARNWN